MTKQDNGQKGYTPQSTPPKPDTNGTFGYTPTKVNDTVNNVAPPPRKK